MPAFASAPAASTSTGTPDAPQTPFPACLAFGSTSAVPLPHFVGPRPLTAVRVTPRSRSPLRVWLRPRGLRVQAGSERPLRASSLRVCLNARRRKHVLQAPQTWQSATSPLPCLRQPSWNARRRCKPRHSCSGGVPLKYVYPFVYVDAAGLPDVAKAPRPRLPRLARATAIALRKPAGRVPHIPPCQTSTVTCSSNASSTSKRHEVREKRTPQATAAVACRASSGFYRVLPCPQAPQSLFGRSGRGAMPASEQAISAKWKMRRVSGERAPWQVDDGLLQAQ